MSHRSFVFRYTICPQVTRRFWQVTSSSPAAWIKLRTVSVRVLAPSFSARELGKSHGLLSLLTWSQSESTPITVTKRIELLLTICGWNCKGRALSRRVPARVITSVVAGKYGSKKAEAPGRR